ncbi:T9SS type A sorting domain-containing protein [Pontibacter sp. G13]|uniref:T9SS type A sorting domain-containing protein n=1 Tax=Pontibacter sp. G13 TaxID=3074898 RepID=UPI002889B56B|nr:T9SS type A sorting domain-containing protein [Pontibacter sp. G13]WNJ20615.1 T9SS type A sorting domain-containing protein [Pontibacter sp. G13]
MRQFVHHNHESTSFSDRIHSSRIRGNTWRILLICCLLLTGSSAFLTAQTACDFCTETFDINGLPTSYNKTLVDNAIGVTSTVAASNAVTLSGGNSFVRTANVGGTFEIDANSGGGTVIISDAATIGSVNFRNINTNDQITLIIYGSVGNFPNTANWASRNISIFVMPGGSATFNNGITTNGSNSGADFVIENLGTVNVNGNATFGGINTIRNLAEATFNVNGTLNANSSSTFTLVNNGHFDISQILNNNGQNIFNCGYFEVLQVENQSGGYIRNCCKFVVELFIQQLAQLHNYGHFIAGGESDGYLNNHSGSGNDETVLFDGAILQTNKLTWDQGIKVENGGEVLIAITDTDESDILANFTANGGVLPYNGGEGTLYLCYPDDLDISISEQTKLDNEPNLEQIDLEECEEFICEIDDDEGCKETCAPFELIDDDPCTDAFRTLDVTICDNETPYAFGGEQLTMTGTYKDTIPKNDGCDSIVTLNLTINPTFSKTDQATICQDETPFQFGTKSLSTTGVYTEVFTASNGCDSTVELTLTVNPTFSGTDEVTICDQELPYSYGDSSFSEGGEYSVVFSSEKGCDSTISLTLNVNTSLSSKDTVEICTDETPYTFGTQSLTSTGVYDETFTSSAGCDSSVQLFLTVLQSFQKSDSKTICDSELPFQFGTQSLTSAGQYMETFTSAGGCDSIVTLQLTVNPTFDDKDTVRLCADELPYTFGTQSLTQAGDYNEIFTSKDGCDSAVALNLIIWPSYNENDEETVCAAALPFQFGTQSLNTAGTYTETFQSVNGCDSIVELKLIVQEADTSRFYDQICADELPFTFMDSVFTAPGEKHTLLTSSKGCDSLVILTLAVAELYDIDTTVAVCESTLPYPFDGQELFAEGEYTKTLMSAEGCDSVVTLTLVIHESYESEQTAQVCEEELPYAIGDSVFEDPGVYTVEFTTQDGCDSVINFTLELLPEYICAQVCEDYTDGGSIIGYESSPAAYDPDPIQGGELPDGGASPLEYMWLKTTDPSTPLNQWMIIPDALDESYDPGTITETTYYVRCAKAIECGDWVESNVVVKEVNPALKNFWLAKEPGQSDFVFEVAKGNQTIKYLPWGELLYSRYRGDSLLIQGTLRNPDDSVDIFYLYAAFKNKQDWTSWLGSGGTYYAGPYASKHPDWSYFEIDSVQSKVVGFAANAGQSNTLKRLSGNTIHGLQKGRGANGIQEKKNGGYAEFICTGNVVGTAKLAIQIYSHDKSGNNDATNMDGSTPEGADPVIAKSIFNDAEFSVDTWPNPVSGILNVRLIGTDELADFEAPQMVVRDLSGRELIRTPMDQEASQQQIDLSQVAKGIYRLEIWNQGEILHSENISKR